VASNYIIVYYRNYFVDRHATFLRIRFLYALRRVGGVYASLTSQPKQENLRYLVTQHIGSFK
jgi:hypothetical protein